MNYLRHFGLREAPFGITPDTSFFYACRSTQEALNTLLVAVGNGEGFIKITGEVGTGKTLLCRKFLGTLDSGWASAYIPNPNLEPRALVLAIAEELAVPLQPDVDQHHLLRGITRVLLDHARHGRRVLLCMDESQGMPIETLETLRLLTNLETEKRKLLQVVLFGQPELDRKLASASIRQLSQRITFEYALRGLDREEIGAYVEHRLAMRGRRAKQQRCQGTQAIAAAKDLRIALAEVPELEQTAHRKSSKCRDARRNMKRPASTTTTLAIAATA